MTRFKTLALVAATAATVGLASAPKAEAAHFPWGPLAAGVVVGATVGAIAASRPAYAAPVYGGYCYTTRQWVDTPYGPVVRRVRVCE